MSEMIERVENAIAEAMGRDPVAYRGCYTKAARAAIEAMRENTQAMRLAGVSSWCAKPEDLSESATKVFDRIWVAMINAALSEKP